jgi:predicted phosphodiesterase
MRANEHAAAVIADGGDEIHFLFRFRDLIRDTLEEHRKVLNEKQSVWWGWWKRPTEDARMDVWRNLQGEASNDKPIRIGLFHSGNGQVYSARVSQVIPPEDENSPPLLPTPEDKELVPEYYRNSPYSRAWMRLVQIEPKPISFFGEYSFDQLPRLHNYKQEVLDKLRDKVIKSADELRGMDTTIWSVRKKRKGDPEREVVLTTGAVPAAISWNVVNLAQDAILHITDPHFAVGKHRNQHVWRLESENGNRQTLAEAITNALGSIEPGLVIVTGDLTFTGAAEEFQEAVYSLNSLAGKLDLDSDRFVIIPGNHDILWTKNAEYAENAPVTEAPAAAMENYKQFYRQFFTHDSNRRLAMGRRFLLPCGLALEICGLNSSSLETDKKFLAGMGRIEEAAFQEVGNQLKWTGESGLGLRILLTHHHLVLTEDLEPAGDYYRGFGIAIDAARILRLAAKFGVQLVLHGHKHRAFLWRSGVYELPELANPEVANISILGGGSAGSSETDSNKNYFNLIQVSGSKLDLTMYRSPNAGVFTPMNKWMAGLELSGEPRRLVLSEWVPA